MIGFVIAEPFLCLRQRKFVHLAIGIKDLVEGLAFIFRLLGDQIGGLDFLDHEAF
jgi:hypothetical protein